MNLETFINGDTGKELQLISPDSMYFFSARFHFFQI